MPSPFIDFHYNNSESDHTTRIAEYSEKRLTIEAPNGINVSTAASLQVNALDVSLSSHNHDTRYPKWYRCANLRLYPGTKVITGISSQYSQQLIGFDELNVFSPDSSSAGPGVGAGGGNGFDFELPEYDFIGEAVQTGLRPRKGDAYAPKNPSH